MANWLNSILQYKKSNAIYTFHQQEPIEHLLLHAVVTSILIASKHGTIFKIKTQSFHYRNRNKGKRLAYYHPVWQKMRNSALNHKKGICFHFDQGQWVNILTHCIIDRKWKIRNWNLGMDFPNKKMEHNNVEQGTDFQ